MGFTELRVGLMALEVTPKIRLTEDDFKSMTLDYALCDAEGQLDAKHFEEVCGWRTLTLTLTLTHHVHIAHHR